MKTIIRILSFTLFVIPLGVSASDWSRGDLLSFDTRKVLGTLGKALVIEDEIPTLEKSKLIGRDQADAHADLNKLIDEAMALLESRAISSLRTQYRQLEKRIAEEKQKLTRYRSERILAVQDDVSMRTRLMPGETLKALVAVTRADFDLLIEATEKNIASYEEDRAKTITDISQALSAIGVNLNSDQLEALMSSIIGDDIVGMSVVFNAIKDVTVQLAELTRESGEDLANAKKYYGMVVILHRIIGSMQENFLAKVDSGYLPKLQEYRKTAQANIKESRELIKSGANATTLQNNIRSNELTIEVIALYSSMLNNQRRKVSEGHKVTLQEMRVARNTYNTVALSSAVVAMIREGQNTFEQLISLQMPDIREFQNDQVREEFRNLTARLAL